LFEAVVEMVKRQRHESNVTIILSYRRSGSGVDVVKVKLKMWKMEMLFWRKDAEKEGKRKKEHSS